MSETQSAKFVWQWNWKVLLFCALLLPLLISLGFWQLQRAAEKQQIVDRYDANRSASPAAITDLDSVEDLQYRPAWISGELDGDKIIFLDNRVKHGKPGYEVLQLLRIEGDSRAVLVNRGWLPAPLDRQQLPDVQTPAGKVQLRGSLYRSLEEGFQLDDGVRGIERWPARIGWISVVRAEQLFQSDLYPYRLRLDRDSRGALETGWMLVNVQPEKHTAYAVQWFSMALVLLVLTLFASSNLGPLIKNRKAKRDQSDTQ